MNARRKGFTNGRTDASEEALKWRGRERRYGRMVDRSKKCWGNKWKERRDRLRGGA